MFSEFNSILNELHDSAYSTMKPHLLNKPFFVTKKGDVFYFQGIRFSSTIMLAFEDTYFQFMHVDPNDAVLDTVQDEGFKKALQKVRSIFEASEELKVVIKDYITKNYNVRLDGDKATLQSFYSTIGHNGGVSVIARGTSSMFSTRSTRLTWEKK